MNAHNDCEMYLWMTRDGCGNYALHRVKPRFIQRGLGFWTARKATWIERMCDDTKVFLGLSRHLAKGKRGIVKIKLNISHEAVP